MTISDALSNVTRLFLDTAPVIYFVEQNLEYAATVDFIFEKIDQQKITAVTSPITLAEALIQPIKLGDWQLQQDFADLITQGQNTVFLSISGSEATEAARLRAHYNLSLTDALQLSAALNAGCDAFLTNDKIFRRVTELPVIVLSDIEA